MSNQKIVLLDGRRPGDDAMDASLAVLSDVLKQSGGEVQVFPLRELKLAHCIGDFACWVETPGLCRFGEAAGREILQAVIQSDTLILFTPVVFGGYSSQLKQIVDRFASLCLPFFGEVHGEVHHRARYYRNPRWVAVGVQAEANAGEAEIFKLLVGRNAINFHAPSFAAEVVQRTEPPEAQREVFRTLLTRKDPFPRGASIRPLLPAATPNLNPAGPDQSGKALLIIGSPKTLTPSTSGVLGSYLLERLKEHGWETESLTLKPNLRAKAGQAELLSAVDSADLLIFAFPLYIDTLPYLMIKALEVIAEHRLSQPVSEHPQSQSLFAIANNGFVESYQNHLALSVCQRFAAASGITWLGGMAMGAGEVISGGQPLKPMSTVGLPCFHVIQALDSAGEALAQGQAVPVEAVEGIERNPIPHMPFAFWRWMFLYNGNQMWKKRAAEHGVNKSKMIARPYTGNAAS